MSGIISASNRCSSSRPPTRGSVRRTRMRAIGPIYLVNSFSASSMTADVSATAPAAAAFAVIGCDAWAVAEPT
ncbi:MAG: hypothetical protein AW07_00763 [Candidatus Accumulibacter sp. SK-11]|nr:MAG: hypothetical protein AW07_00763 [Candidatus Accumulibacter sp. SK-11]